MRKIELEEFKKINLEILKCVHEFCLSHNIHYSLAYGSMLGAIRHHGFIPWDDDIDICMPRPDYERFIREFNGNYSHLELKAPELDWSYYSTYANIMDIRTVLVETNKNLHGIKLGVKIDVFPLDGCPEDERTYHSHIERIRYCNRVMAAKRNKLSNYYKFPLKLLKVLSIKAFLSLKQYSSYQQYVHKLALMYKFEESRYVDSIVHTAYKFKRHDRHCYDDYIDVKFEDAFFKVAIGYDQILTTIYGDYMTPPPEDKRISHHYFDAWWKE